MAFEPNAIDCIRLEDELRKSKAYNDELLKQNQNLTKALYETHSQLDTYDQKNMKALEEAIIEKLKKEGMVDPHIIYDINTNMMHITRKDKEKKNDL